MRFAPIFGEDAKGRKYLGAKWFRKQLRGMMALSDIAKQYLGKCI